MISDSYIVPECAVRPGSFGALMALYETNFIKVSLLLGNAELDTCDADDCLISTAPGDCDLHLWVESQARYTRVLRMTYMFDEDGEMLADPDLVVRIYSDARMAQVAGWAEYHRHAVLDDMAARFAGELNRRWSQNMMLSKWLDYLLESGHSFAPAANEVQRSEVVGSF